MKSKITPEVLSDTDKMFRNRQTLLACKGHVWIPDGPRFRCTVCTGYAAPLLKEIYEQGKKHGGAK